MTRRGGGNSNRTEGTARAKALRLRGARLYLLCNINDTFCTHVHTCTHTHPIYSSLPVPHTVPAFSPLFLTVLEKWHEDGIERSEKRGDVWSPVGTRPEEPGRLVSQGSLSEITLV